MSDELSEKLIRLYGKTWQELLMEPEVKHLPNGDIEIQDSIVDSLFHTVSDGVWENYNPTGISRYVKIPNFTVEEAWSYVMANGTEAKPLPGENKKAYLLRTIGTNPEAERAAVLNRIVEDLLLQTPGFNVDKAGDFLYRFYRR